MIHIEKLRQTDEQPISDYLTNIIMNHLSDFEENGSINTKRIIDRVYNYARTIGYKHGEHELRAIIKRQSYIVGFLGAAEPGKSDNLDNCRLPE